jgi:uncharacterized BrkB/YihY/UPF0761 family membrane protein
MWRSTRPRLLHSHRVNADTPFVTATSSTRPRRPNVFHALAAGALGLAAFIVAVLGYYGTAYIGSTGCEDYGIACHEADPVRAGAWAAATLAVILGCVILAASLMATNRTSRRRSIVGGAVLAVGIVSAALILPW